MSKTGPPQSPEGPYVTTAVGAGIVVPLPTIVAGLNVGSPLAER